MEISFLGRDSFNEGVSWSRLAVRAERESFHKHTVELPKLHLAYAKDHLSGGVTGRTLELPPA